MNFQDCIAFATEHPVCCLATAEGDQPRVRAFHMWFADETGFYFHTAASKQVCRQLQENPRVEVCFHAPGLPPDPGRTMRVAGTVEFIEDIPLKNVLLEERPFLKRIGTGRPDDPLLMVFRIGRGEAYFWSTADNLRESAVERIPFKAPPWPRGHYSELPPRR